MIIKVNATQLRDAVKQINLVPVRRTLPVLSHVRLTASSNQATLTSTDLEKAVEVSIACVMEEDMDILLPRKNILPFLTGISNPKELITITATDKGEVTLQREGIGSIQLLPQSAKEFPPIPKPETEPIWYEIDAKWLCRMLGILLPACAWEESRPLLTGVCFKEGKMASADGFRLVSVESDNLRLGLETSEANIPNSTLDIARRLFAKRDKVSVAVELKRNTVRFESNGVLLTSQMIQGTYPQWEQLIPQSYTSRISVSSPLMLQRLNMIDPHLIPSGIIKLQFAKQKETDESICSLVAGQKDEDYAGYYSLNLPVTIETQEGSSIAFNHKYLCEALKPFSICHLELNSPSSPGKFTGDIEGTTIVVMPLFVQW